MSTRTIIDQLDTVNPLDIIKDGHYAAIPNSILSSPDMTDSEKLLLARLFQYAGKNEHAYPYRKTLVTDMGWTLQKLKRILTSLRAKGFVKTLRKAQNAPRVYVFLNHEVYKGRVKDEPSGGVKNERTIYEYLSMNTKEVPNGTSTCTKNVQGIVSLPQETKQSRAKKRELLRLKKVISPQTEALLTYWNTKEHLRTHNIKEGSVYTEQTKIVQKADRAISELLAGTYFSHHDEVPPAMKTKSFKVDELKKCIDKLDISQSPQYRSYMTKKFKKLGILDFIESPYAKLGKNVNDKFKWRYPVIHWLYNEPVATSEQHFKSKTKYEILVNKVIAKLKDRALKTRQYNQVVKQVEKAVELIDDKANGNRMELRRRLPDLLYDSLEQVGKGHTVDSLPLGVYNLERMMKERLMI